MTSPFKAGSLAKELRTYHGAGQPNPVVVPVPAHVNIRVRGVGLLTPRPPPPLAMGPNTLAIAWWCGPRELTVGCASEQSAHGILLHLSVSQGKGLPTWDTMRALREAFFPDTVDVAMILPRRADYVNVAEVLHLTQMPVEWGLR